MPVSAQHRHTVESMFKAMQAGPDGEEAMLSLFADDAVLIEPFSGQSQTHAGKPAIRQSFRDQWKDPPPDLTLVLDRIDLDGLTCVPTGRARHLCSRRRCAATTSSRWTPSGRSRDSRSS